MSNEELQSLKHIVNQMELNQRNEVIEAQKLIVFESINDLLPNVTTSLVMDYLVTDDCQCKCHGSTQIVGCKIKVCDKLDCWECGSCNETICNSCENIEDAKPCCCKHNKYDTKVCICCSWRQCTKLPTDKQCQSCGGNILCEISPKCPNSNCNHVICRDCVLKCNCYNIDKSVGGCCFCFLKCYGCEEQMCKKCPQRKCNSSDCDETMCKNCVKECSSCQDAFCSDHFRTCSFCKILYCDECSRISECSVCLKKYCDNCSQDCNLCDNQVCSLSCLSYCYTCNQLFCDKHEDHGSKCNGSDADTSDNDNIQRFFTPSDNEIVEPGLGKSGEENLTIVITPVKEEEKKEPTLVSTKRKRRNTNARPRGCITRLNQWAKRLRKHH
jgi:hypothetical protein